MKTNRILNSILLGCLALSLSCARTATLHRGDDAARLLPTDDLLLSPGKFTYDEARDRISRKLIIAIFNCREESGAGGNFRWIRKDTTVDDRYLPQTWNVVLLDASKGTPGIAPTKEILQEIANSKLVPAVVTDGEDRVRAVVYRPALLSLAAFLRPDGTTRLEFGSRQLGTPDIPYSLKLK